jgi:hypothetical protein
MPRRLIGEVREETQGKALPACAFLRALHALEFMHKEFRIQT